MALLNTIYNLVSCGTDAILGTGTKGCKQILQKTSSLWITPQGFKYDGTSTLDETYAQLEQAKGNLIILKGITTFTDNSSEDVIETLDDGTKQIATLGLYEFAVVFIKGLAFNAAIHSLNSFGNYDMTFVDGNGNLLGTKAADGSMKGFSMGMLQGIKLSFPTDSTGQKEGIMFQFSTRSELDTDYVYIQQTQIAPFKPQTLDGINEVELTWDAVPAAAATTVVVSARSKQNQILWEGGLTGDFELRRNDVVESQSVNEVTGVYTFTVAAVVAADVWTVHLHDTANSREVILKDTDLYKSDTPSVIAV